MCTDEVLGCVSRMPELASLRLTCCVVPDALQLPLLARFAHLARLQARACLSASENLLMSCWECCHTHAAELRGLPGHPAEFEQVWCLAPPDAEESGRDINRSLQRMLSRNSGKAS